MQVANGTTDVTTYFVLRDSTNHAPKTDVTVTDIDLYYCEQGAAMAAKVDATALAAADSAHADNKAFHVGQGLYRVDWPDAAFDGGVGKVVNLIVVCTGVDTTFLEVELTGVAQTGDAYAVVAHADYGNAKLVRSTTPANTLDVSATGEAGLDFANIKAATAPTTLTNIVVPTVTTLTGHTAQTGDSFARLGAPAGASVSADIAAVKAQTAAIEADTQDLQTQVGTDGAGLTAVPWNAAWDAEVQSEAADALTAYDPPTKAELDSAVAPLATAAALATVDGIVDDILVDTGTTLQGELDGIQADTEDLQTQIGVAGAGLSAIPWNAAWDAEVESECDDALVGFNLPTNDTIADAVWNEASAHHVAAGSTGKVIADILEDTGTTIPADIAALPTDADVQTAATAALNAYDPPTNAEMEARTILAASYFDPAADTVAHVTLVDTTTTNTDMVAAAPAVGDIADAVWDEAIAGHAVAGSTGAALSAATAPTAAAVADAVWEEAIADHSGTVGSTAEQLAAAGAAGDPWITALPGAYAAGTAGDIIGNLVTDVGSLVPAVAVSSTTAASVASGILAIRAYHTLDQQITSTTTSDLSSATKLWLAIKIAASDDDDEAVAFIEVVDGLTVLAQAAYTTVAHGSLTLGGVAGAWTIDVGMDEVATGLLTAYAGQMLHAECKALVGGATVAVWDGVCDVSHGIVHAVA